MRGAAVGTPGHTPGSVCLKVWTAADADPTAQRPDRLVCVTARTDDELRASVFEQREPGLPRRLGSASVRVNESGRSLVLRIAQSSLGRPELIRFAVDATRPGCVRVSCIDAAPDDGAVRRFRLRGSPGARRPARAAVQGPSGRP